MKSETPLKNHIDRLKKHIEFKAGFKVIAFHDCKVLSKRLREEKIAVSSLTIARIFNLSDGVKKPYLSTLDLLSQYLGFNSFSNFIHESERFSKNWLFNPSNETSAFCIQALELAIQQSDWKSVKKLLENSNPDKDDYEFPMFLGIAVRNHPKRNEFLAALMDVEVGRVYFYDRFVDEDDPDGYFSDALNIFASNFNKDRGKQIFKTSFQMAKKIYSGQKVNQTDLNLLKDKDWNCKDLHFHQISRWYEAQILMLASNNQPFHLIEIILAELITIVPQHPIPAQNWIIARSIKALLHFRLLDKAMLIPEFRTCVLKVHASTGDQIKSIGELIVQLVSHAYFNSDRILDIPKSISSSHFNETHSRIAIESATALIYANDPLKEIILKNLKPFALRTGNQWVLNLFNKEK